MNIYFKKNEEVQDYFLKRYLEEEELNVDELRKTMQNDKKEPEKRKENFNIGKELDLYEQMNKK